MPAAATASGPNGASGWASRQAALDTRRAQAVERLWAEVVELGRFKGLSQMTGALVMDAVMDRASGRSSEAVKMQEFAEMILKTSGITDVKMGNVADKERPFVDPVAWAMFSAYRQMLTYPAIQLLIAKGGVGKDVLSDTLVMLQPIKVAIPEYSEYIDKFGL